MFRGEDINSKVWSTEAHLLAALGDLWSKKPFPRPAEQVEKQQRLRRREEKARRMLARSRERGDR